MNASPPSPSPSHSGPWVFLNGAFVPEAGARVSVFDRSFLLGDGLFETVRVVNSRPFLWTEHLARLRFGLHHLRIQIPYSDAELTDAAHESISRNGFAGAVLRLHVSRGRGARGYSPHGATDPTVVITLHALDDTSRTLPAPWRLITSSVRVIAGDPLSAMKTASKLPNIIARMEAEDAGVEEALLLNSRGDVAETASSNIFWVENDDLLTPPLVAGALAGVTRGFVFRLCLDLNLAVQEATCPTSRLIASDGVFLTVSTLGIVGVTSLDGHPLALSPLIGRLQAAYGEALQQSV
ncbi:MAG: branched-chain amino acid aminotransferase [Pedosphaera sp.]|nr:branched-chain amino acid aminotransferase [Pedosphaera sp.]